MPNEINEEAPPAPPDNGYMEQVLARYEARHGSFIKQSTIFLIFVFSFLAFILVPIMSLKVEEYRVALETREIAEIQEQKDMLQAQSAELADLQGLVNGELTSLNFERAKREEAAENAERERAALKQSLERMEAGKAEQEEQLALLQDSETGMGKALGIFDVERRVNELRSWFREKMAGCDQVRECRDNRQDYYARGVRAKLQADWDGDFDFVNQEIVEPLRPVEPEIAETIERRLTEAREVFETNLNQDPRFWHTINEKEEFMEKLAVEWAQGFASIQSIVHERSSQVRNEITKLESTLARITEEESAVNTMLAAIQREQLEILKDLKDAAAREQEFRDRQEEIEAKAKEVEEKLAEFPPDLIESLRARQAEIRKEQKEIEQRLSKFQSPFGALPLGFKEAAFAFPFILATGYLVCALLLASLIRLRREYHQSMRSGTSLDAKTLTDRVSLIAPLWLDPAVRSWRNVAVIFLLLLPIPTFLVTAVFILSDWLQLATEQSGRILMLFYDVLYLVGLLLLIVGIWRVGSEWRRYRKLSLPFSFHTD